MAGSSSQGRVHESVKLQEWYCGDSICLEYNAIHREMGPVASEESIEARESVFAVPPKDGIKLSQKFYCTLDKSYPRILFGGGARYPWGVSCGGSVGYEVAEGIRVEREGRGRRISRGSGRRVCGA